MFAVQEITMTAAELYVVATVDDTLKLGCTADAKPLPDTVFIAHFSGLKCISGTVYCSHVSKMVVIFNRVLEYNT